MDRDHQQVPTQGFVVLKVDPNSDTIYAEAPGSGIGSGHLTIRSCLGKAMNAGSPGH